MSIPTATAAGPLTTVFTAAPSCSSDFVYYGYSAGLDYVDRDTYSASVCYPLGRLNLLEVYFSPGVCPSGWTSGGYVYTTSFFWAPSLAPDETAAICCPSGYTPNFPANPTPPVPTWASCVSALQSPLLAATCNRCPRTLTVDTTRAGGARMTAVEETIMVRWRSADLPVLAVEPSLPSPPASPESPIATSTSPAQSSGSGGVAADGGSAGSGSASPSSVGLTTGAKAGIGVGAALGVIAILCLAALLLARRRRRARHAVPPPRDDAKELHTDSGAGSGELLDGAKELPADPPTKPELFGTGAVPAEASELRAGVDEPRHPVEVDASPSFPSELDTTPHEPLPASSVEVASPPEAAPISYSQPTPGPAGPSQRTDVATGYNDADEDARLEAEERHLAERRVTLRETLRVLEEDERLRLEQEAVRRRRRELRRETSGGLTKSGQQ